MKIVKMNNCSRAIICAVPFSENNYGCALYYDDFFIKYSMWELISLLSPIGNQHEMAETVSFT